MKLPTSTAESLLKSSGTKRIGYSAKEQLQAELNKKIEEITKKAAVFSKHAGRKTIRKEDIELVIS